MYSKARLGSSFIDENLSNCAGFPVCYPFYSGSAICVKLGTNLLYILRIPKKDSNSFTIVVCVKPNIAYAVWKDNYGLLGHVTFRRQSGLAENTLCVVKCPSNEACLSSKQTILSSDRCVSRSLKN